MPADRRPRALWASMFAAAADIIEEGGWCQRKSRVGSKFCLYGAILEASMRCGLTGAERDEAVAWLTATSPELDPPIPGFAGASLTRWNDRRGRRAGEVVALLRAAAARLERGLARRLRSAGRRS